MSPVTVTLSISFHTALNAVCRSVEASADPGFEFSLGDADRLESAARDIRQAVSDREQRLKTVADAQHSYDDSHQNQ